MIKTSLKNLVPDIKIVEPIGAQKDNYLHVVMASLVKHYDVKNYLELGTSYGYNAVTVRHALAKESQLRSVDILEIGANHTGRDYIKHFNDQSTTLFSCGSETFDWQKYAPYDFIYIDGDHSYKGLINDTFNALKYITDDGIIMWDDYGNDPPYGLEEDVNFFIDSFDGIKKLYHIDKTRFIIHKESL